MKQQGVRWHKKRRQITVLSVCMVLFNQGLHLVDFLWAPSLESACPVPTSCEFNLSGENIVQMHYESLHGGSAVHFSVVLHDPDTDQIISRSIKEGKRGYDSINELHSICEHNQSGYTVHCGPGKVFVEVGSALGMVSLYAATRGMRVYAFDPLPPNIQRLDESLCLNGERRCLMEGEDSSEKRFRCSRPSDDWGSYAPGKFSRFCNLVGAHRDDYGRVVESEPGNMAATMRGGGSVRARVKVVTIHEAVRDSVIEVLLLTCQGFEYEVRFLNFILLHIIHLPVLHPGTARSPGAREVGEDSKHHLAAAPHECRV